MTFDKRAEENELEFKIELIFESEPEKFERAYTWTKCLYCDGHLRPRRTGQTDDNQSGNVIRHP